MAARLLRSGGWPLARALLLLGSTVRSRRCEKSQPERQSAAIRDPRQDAFTPNCGMFSLVPSEEPGVGTIAIAGDASVPDALVFKVPLRLMSGARHHIQQRASMALTCPLPFRTS